MPGRSLTGAAVLLLVRDGVATDVPTLSREFGFDASPTAQYAGEYYVRAKLDDLQQLGLIVDTGDDHYEVADRWREIQAALDMSLTQAVKLNPQSLIVEPFFGAADHLAQQLDVFVAMPFAPELTPVWADHIRAVTHSLDLVAARGDDFFTAHSIMSDVWTALTTARVVIADCTGRNPNVFYEIGVAHTIGKPVILITQNGDDVPFDLRHIRYINYAYTPPGMKEFEGTLADTLKTTLELKSS